MAVEEDNAPANPMERTLQRIRERYREEHGEEPPEEFIEQARREIIRGIGRRDRDEHRDIYDALAQE